MKPRSYIAVGLAVSCGVAALLSTGCAGRTKADTAAEAPPTVQVEHEQDAATFRVENPEQFPLVAAGRYDEAPELKVTGTVNPDISRNVPVVSLASGRVVGIFARLGDTVHKGQLLLQVRSDDVTGGFSDYRKAVADEALARAQLVRTQDLFNHGAMAKADLELALDSEDKAKVDLETTAEHLRLLGNDPEKFKNVVDIAAPSSGVITDQEVTNAAGVQALGANPFTISDLSQVWVVCDVYENDMGFVRLGESADIRLNAFPDLVLKGRISNIGAVMDPNLRTAKVRLEVQNPGMLRLGMFGTATFYGAAKESHSTVPATAVLHLHDRDWVYVPAEGGRVHRIEVTGGKMLPGNLQEINSGLQAGQQVISNALDLQATVEQ
jgi:cobalt-zinc-cadmium efflux system membrane fusion protein